MKLKNGDSKTISVITTITGFSVKYESHMGRKSGPPIIQQVIKYKLESAEEWPEKKINKKCNNGLALKKRGLHITFVIFADSNRSKRQNC